MVSGRTLPDATRSSSVHIVERAAATTEVSVNVRRRLFPSGVRRRYDVHFPTQSRQMLGQARPPLSTNRAVGREMVGNDEEPAHLGLAGRFLLRAFHWHLNGNRAAERSCKRRGANILSVESRHKHLG